MKKIGSRQQQSYLLLITLWPAGWHTYIGLHLWLGITVIINIEFDAGSHRNIEVKLSSIDKINYDFSMALTLYLICLSIDMLVCYTVGNTLSVPPLCGVIQHNTL